jgi:uncharacterized repeat protein (TIGR01451 family)
VNRFSPRLASRLLGGFALLAVLMGVPLAVMAEESEPVASISLSVLPDTPDGTARYDTVLRYVFTIRNTGEVVLTDIALTDTLCGDVGAVSSLSPGSTVEFEGWARVESGEGVATVRALAPGSVEVSATAVHAIEPYISHDWPDEESAVPDPASAAAQTVAPVTAVAPDAAAAGEPFLPFTGESPARYLTLAWATGLALLGAILRRRARAI